MGTPNFNRKIDVDIHIRFPITFISLVVLLSLPYLTWEIYWAVKVGYAVIKWHTHLALYYYLWLLLFLILYGLNGIFHFRDYVKYQVVCASVCFSLLFMEALLLTLGIGDTYSEKIRHGYVSKYSSEWETYYRTYLPYQELVMDRIDFKHVRQVNSLGFSDREWAVEKTKNEKRILCLGDSWTEGIGAVHDSTYVSILGSLLRQKDTSYTVMNAGTAGDDPCVNFVNYRDHLAKFKPDIIIQTLSSNDMNTDIATKGGMERFQQNGTIKLPDAPWWEPLYALSYISRTLFHAMGYNELLLREPFSAELKTKLDQQAMVLFNLYSELAKKEGALLIVVLQTDGRGRDYDLSPIVKHLQTLDNVKVYDLLPYYLGEFDKNGDNTDAYYWKHDGHHTAKGYVLMAKGIEKAIDSFYVRPNNVSPHTDTTQIQ